MSWYSEEETLGDIYIITQCHWAQVILLKVIDFLGLWNQMYFGFPSAKKLVSAAADRKFKMFILGMANGIAEPQFVFNELVPNL